MWPILRAFKKTDRQTKFFIFTGAIYMIAIIWTTLQSYARLEYSRSDVAQDKVIEIQTPHS